MTVKLGHLLFGFGVAVPREQHGAWPSTTVGAPEVELAARACKSRSVAPAAFLLGERLCPRRRSLLLCCFSSRRHALCLAALAALLAPCVHWSVLTCPSARGWFALSGVLRSCRG